MKTSYLLKLILAIALSNAVSVFPQNQNDALKIWFTRPATGWENALPVGNGRLGAMVFGGVESERIQLNEESVWLGGERDYHNPDALATLDEVRKLLFEGKFEEAEKLAQEKIMGSRDGHPERGTYQTLGDLHLEFETTGRTSNYKRELDIENAIARVSFQSGGTHYEREIFSSWPDQAIVINLTASEENKITFKACLSRPNNLAKIKAKGNEITMSEHVGWGTGVKMASRLKIVAEGGKIIQLNDSLKVENASKAVLFITAATDYRGEDPFLVSEQQIEAVSQKNYNDILKSHITDYQSYFNRVDFNLGKTDAVYFTTDARIDAIKNGNTDPHLIELYYQFGRYMLISSSRPGCLPANLQGIWADGLYPPWNADYHININIQMNYWPAEITNLSELHMPFLEFIDQLRPDGRKTAKQVYGCDGIVAHYTTDLWHFTEPTGMIRYALWPMGIAWSCQHYWEHYLFTGDNDFLKNLAYPVMKEASEFCMDWLVEHPKTRKLVSGPSISPENKFITPKGNNASLVMGPTMDHMIIWDLLTNTISASEVLEMDQEFREQMVATLDRLQPLQIGSDGRLMEWTKEFEEADPGHRHISHLFGLHPGKQITKQHNPEYLEAARKTIDFRLQNGGGHTGWSRAWIINFFARLQDGEAAYENLMELLRKSTLHNLFDTHPPFQIDGNFGATAGITEMLLQSHAGEVHLLPALPKAWQKGHIRGICARGGFVVDIDWDNGRLRQVKIHSKLGNKCKIRYGGNIIEINTEQGVDYYFDGGLKRVNP